MAGVRLLPKRLRARAGFETDPGSSDFAELARDSTNTELVNRTWGIMCLEVGSHTKRGGVGAPFNSTFPKST